MIYRNCRYLLDDIQAKGHRPIFLGAAPDGSPIVAIQSGGDREPAVFISTLVVGLNFASDGLANALGLDAARGLGGGS